MARDTQTAVSESIAHQNEPLIVNGEPEAQAIVTEKVSYRHLPNKRQLAILCIARMADPLAATSIQVCNNRTLPYLRSSDFIDVYVLSAQVLRSNSLGRPHFDASRHNRRRKDRSTSLYRHVMGQVS